MRAESVPARIVARAKALRLARDWDEAKDVWRGQTGADQTAAMWSERNALVRELLSQRDDRTAYEIAKTHGQTDTESLTDAEFLCGFIALRRLNTPDIALGHFRTLAKASPAAITQGRAHYWIGRALAASGRDPKVSYGEAAKWPTTFYGQLAGLASNLDIKSRILAATDPVVASNYNHELIRAAKLLLEWGDPGRARVFLVRLDEIAPNAAIRSTVARRAVEIGAPDSAVYIARRMGRDGIALPVAGWPAPYAPPEVVEPAYALGIMRQESSFDVAAVSRSGALGLMQLMPATARTVAKGLKVPLSIPALTVDPNANMRLGTAYLRELLDRFYGSYILAAAGYNAGPNRVDQWMALNGDPTASFDAMLDWIELIPFAETRNYVQRVAENVTIYRARAGDGRPVLDPR